MYVTLRRRRRSFREIACLVDCYSAVDGCYGAGLKLAVQSCLRLLVVYGCLLETGYCWAAQLLVDAGYDWFSSKFHVSAYDWCDQCTFFWLLFVWPIFWLVVDFLFASNCWSDNFLVSRPRNIYECHCSCSSFDFFLVIFYKSFFFKRQ